MLERGTVSGSRSRQDELMGPGQPAHHNAEESRYSAHVRNALLKLLKGDRDRLDLLVKYHREPNRLGILTVPLGMDTKALRTPRVEETLRAALSFLHDGSAGGPVSSSEDRSLGLIVQTRDFPTRFPHIVIQRTDSFDAKTGDPVKSRWTARRLQNQQSSIQTNRALDALNLGVEILKFVL